MKFTQSIFAAAFAFAAAAAFAAPVTTQGVGVGKHGDIQVAVTFDNGKFRKSTFRRMPRIRCLPKRFSRI